MNKILSGILSLVAVFSFAVVAHAATSTVVVTGDTSAGENQPGWLFNRDTSTSTPFEFNEDQASIGEGSLYVQPIGANASDKFIAENFINAPIADINSVSYDFMIGSGGTVSDANEFYMNVYANFGESDDDKFYDCRYNIVPTTGSTSAFTTVTFDPTQAYPVATRTGANASPYTCPAVPADMDTLSEGSTIRVFSLNVGDTSANDVGLDGYLDKVVVSAGDDVTTYDFEAVYPVSGEITSPEEGATVSGDVTFSATYNDGDDENDDAVQWAVRQGSCSTNTVFGNVDGQSDTFDWDGMNFSATADTSEWEAGEYCFVFNPVDDEGQDDVRLTRTFTVEEVLVGPPTDKDQCKRGGWRDFNNPSFSNQGQCVRYVNGNGNNTNVSSRNTVRVNQNNTSNVSNTVAVSQNTGGNRANGNTGSGNVEITTGDNSTVVEIVTRAARNIFFFWR